MKTNVAFLLLTILLSIVAQNLLAGGGRDDSTQPQRNENPAREIEATGRVRLVGSSFFPSLVISGEEREWHIYYGEQEKFLELQQQIITVRAQEYYQDLIFGNGLPAGRRFFLRNITVIRIGS